jgi:hypothetical protein
MVLDAAPMAPGGRRGADQEALRGLPTARRADRHLCQQARPGRRDRVLAGTRPEPRLLADRHGRDYLHTYDLFADALLLSERGSGAEI